MLSSCLAVGLIDEVDEEAEEGWLYIYLFVLILFVCFDYGKKNGGF